MYTNLDCLSNKKDEREDFIYLNNIDIALICETLPQNTADPLAKNLTLSIHGYDYNEDSFDRGVCVIHKKLSISQNIMTLKKIIALHYLLK